MGIEFGRDICGHLPTSEAREWLVTNGNGGYGAGTVSGVLTRRYHGLLIAALNPPLGRTLLLTKLDELVQYRGQIYPLYTDRWADGSVAPQGYREIESFHLDGSIPVWKFAIADAILEKRLWMQPGENTTYIRYTLHRARSPLSLSLKALVNYRDFHGETYSGDWQMKTDIIDGGIRITAFAGATPFYLFAEREGNNVLPKPQWERTHTWYKDYNLTVEKYRGLSDREDNLYIANLEVTLQPGNSLTTIASTMQFPTLQGEESLQEYRKRDRALLDRWYKTPYLFANEEQKNTVPDWIKQLVLASDRFIVDRTLPDEPEGKTIIAGYPWFGDWGRDTMISLPGLTLCTGRPEIAKIILQTFAQYLDRGMLPNLFPDGTNSPEYNTVDAILWYFEAIRAYYAATQDIHFIRELFPALEEAIEWHVRGTRYNIKVDSKDGLLYAGETGLQLTWMDAKVDDWVVTPRIGKPIEINALWYSALVLMAHLAKELGKPSERYEAMAQKAIAGFSRFWNYGMGYCYDVIDGPEGNDPSLRPNQIFAVSLPAGLAEIGGSSLLLPREEKSVIDAVAQSLLTSHGLRSLSPDDPNYAGVYGGDRYQRDSHYHQGTVWGWLIGHFVQGHLHVYNNPTLAREFLSPMEHHLQASCVGNLSEIFDGDAPMTPRGTFAQAWTVAEVLRAWLLTR
ncbi:MULTISPECIES: amylo-alpha-1,6-glucosidase [Spirulina sp. CCY15215]|uniref:amylo-alpha-1,6-glucosidase n=1 Tax=Spirulina sp. CCY15215 TaxID=2767591 RepID=UPI00194FD801|nr:amylo-alpha-1,6-glucosidase [Spirulina major]